MGEDQLMRVSEIMTKKPITINIGSSISKVAKLMQKYRVGHILVMDGDVLAGIVTVDDIVRKGVAANMDAKKTKVDDLMTSDIISIEPTADIRELMELFSESDIRQVPVMDKESLVGFVTMKDVLRVEPALMDLAINKIRFEEESRQQRIQKFSDDEFLADDEDLFE